jgi:hypothetical protein
LSADPSQQPGGPAGAPGEPSEDEIRAAYEAELSRITATDMMAQSAVSLLNIGARRLGAPGAPGAGPTADQRDLEQVRDAIDGARALLDILERRIPQELGPLRDALSRLQMTYAREVQTGASAAGGAEPQGSQPPADGAGQAPPPAASDSEGSSGKPGGPGPAESSGRLWVPGR